MYIYNTNLHHLPAIQEKEGRRRRKEWFHVKSGGADISGEVRRIERREERLIVERKMNRKGINLIEMETYRKLERK